MDERDPKTPEMQPEMQARRRDLEQRLKDLPRDVPPPRDLWPEISARIDAREKEARRPNRAVALAFVGAIAAAAAVALLRGGAPVRSGDDAAARASFSPPSSSPSHVAAIGSAPRPSSAAPILAEEETYEEAARVLRAEYEARKADEPAAVVASVDESVRIVQDAIRAVREALVAHPEDAELRADLDRAHQDEIDVLRAVTEIPPGSGGGASGGAGVER